MTTQQPAKRLSAVAALPLAIIIEAGAIAVNVGGAVTAILAFLLCFGVCHQIRLARWRHRTA
jgi:cytochrome b